MTAPHPLQIVGLRHWKVAMPFVSALEWGSGKRPAATRLIVELRLANGQVGYGETICLLEFIEPVLVNTILPIALQYRASDVEHFTRHVFGAGYYHHKRAAVRRCLRGPGGAECAAGAWQEFNRDRPADALRQRRPDPARRDVHRAARP